MAENVNIGGFGTLFVGEDKNFILETLNVNGIPVDMSTWIILFDVRVSDDAPSPPLISKTATISGVFNASRTLNTQRASVTVTSSDMNNLIARTYQYSWKRTDASNNTVLAYGNFVVQKATAP